MEVCVDSSSGVPAGSILSVRVGQARKQGCIKARRPMHFTATTVEANPFYIDLYAPLASKRLTLVPGSVFYTVDLPSLDGSDMQIKLKVQDTADTTASVERPSTRSMETRREKMRSNCQEYVEQHKLAQFVQNLMQSVLVERPEDPYAYMEQHLRAAKGAVAGPRPPPSQAPSPSALSAAKKRGSAAVPSPPGPLVGPAARDFAGPAFSVQAAGGAITDVRPLELSDLIVEGSQLRRLRIRMLKEKFPSRQIASPLHGMTSSFVDQDSFIAETFHKDGQPRTYYEILRAGPRQTLHFQPEDVVATIVTCGGLCPGLNAVIRQLVQMLSAYGVRKIYGIRGGYKGVLNPKSWVELDTNAVRNIHDLGGTMLSSDRGNPPVEEQAAALKAQGVRQHYVIGGDGTHRGAFATYEAMQALGWECAVVGIPKTIDNDICMLDRTFGFDTACTEAAKAVHAAYTEATCNANCIGLVKLMGRHSGFIAMNACLSARYADICLLPEMDISTEKVLDHCVDLMQSKGHCVVVVGEGCGNTMLKSSGEVDAGGNVKLADVGPWLRDKITERFLQLKLPLTIKYIDPTYMIRAVKPNANDSVYCSVLADNAVHAAMAGYTGVTLGRLNGRYVVMPIQAITSQPSRRVDLCGRWFVRLVTSTLQPDFTPDDKAAMERVGSEPRANPLHEVSDPVDPMDLFGGGELRRLELGHLRTKFGAKELPSTLHETIQGANLGFLNEDSWATQAVQSQSSNDHTVYLQMLRAGPRKVLHFEPAEVAAAIVTCGGLCPGLNSVIRELVNTLFKYGVRKVYGVKGGFKGTVKPSTWVTLTPGNVKDIHTLGGTILVADRGNPADSEVAAVLKSKGIRQFFVIGGDGTHRGANAIYEAMSELGWECAVVGVPKTIDNDIALLDRTFGFDTACSEALKAINTAYVEATCNANCIGLVKLMGRHCGYLAMMAVLSARYVDICLLPEMDVSLEKVLDHAANLVQTQGYAVIVVAEGCGDTLIQASGETDAGGNKKLADVGVWLKDQILDHFKSLKLPLTIKYVDPTYMVRAVPANANDSIYCSMLSQAAVHGAMAGYTGVTVAKVNETFVYLPIYALTSMPNRKVDVTGHWYERLLATTLQPNLSSSGIATAKPTNPGGSNVWSRRRRTGGKASTALEAGEDVLRVPDTTLTVLNGFGQAVTSRPLERADLLCDDAQIRTLRCFHLSDRFGTFDLPSPLVHRLATEFQDTYSWVCQSTTRMQREGGKVEPYYMMLRAGPRAKLHFDPNDPAACAAIVSCGGICPGLNSVIREVVNTLWDYGVRRIYGIKGGYKGVTEPHTWIQLTPSVVKNIHGQGGTILVSDRGNPPAADMAATLKEKGVRQYFVLGGDGTHKGASQTFDACLDIDHECAVIGVPKTIDNDVPLLDQTFGFDTACTEALKAVDSAYVEARCNANCIGLVKLMGRHCGFIAMHATLASRHVDICLLPEMDIDVEKVLNQVAHLMRTKKHAVIVVAEGCGDTMIKSSGAVDAGGNKVLADAGLWLKGAITKRMKELQIPLTVKYIDPTYMIRSIPANAFDSQYCSTLAQNAVHAAMAGYSGVTVGKVHERFVYLPIHAITNQKGRRVDPTGRWFNRMLEATKQPDFRPDGAQASADALASSTQVASALDCLSSPGSINSVLEPGDEIRRLELVHLGTRFPSADAPNGFSGLHGPSIERGYLGPSSWATKTFVRLNKRDISGHVYYQMLLGGPRRTLHFNPAESTAVIVTCGGLCPGLNSVIREIVMTLTAYGVPNIFGCKGGYKGMVEPDKWIKLTPAVVKDIHNRGGTMLVSDRGNPPHIEIAKTLKERNVTQYFVIGGDGTHQGAMSIFKCTDQIDHNCAVVGVPKTIDNDIPVLDRSFGYKTSCTEAVKAINAAYTEAASNTNCIGLVKLMGRHCGWIAMEATLAARGVDICLIPEMNVSLPKLLTLALNLIKKKGHAVIVVAEGCGDTFIQSTGEKDAGGNKKLADVGPWLQARLYEFFRKMQVELTVKFIDPTYTIRAVPANANDSVYCSVLAQHAVHGAMAGYSGITVGKVDERFVMLPIHAITGGQRKVELDSRLFERLMTTTGQPSLAPGAGDDWALMPKAPPARSKVTTEANHEAPEITVAEWRRTLMDSDSAMPVGSEELPGVGFRVLSGHGEEREMRTASTTDVVGEGTEMRRLEVMRVSDRFNTGGSVPSPLRGSGFMADESWAFEALATSEAKIYYQLLRAGPREMMHFDPQDPASCAAVVTCGGISPGENAAIREIVQSLRRYGVNRVYGITDGYLGILAKGRWVELTDDYVQSIHQRGGTILRTRRGNPDHVEAAKVLKDNGVRQLFVLGGDGAMRGALQMTTALAAVNHECACVAIPATINNDIPLVDRTFGFDTACTVARDSLTAAYVEATCNANCIGLVKLAGNTSGFLTLEATLAARNVDMCLLPEMAISLEKVLDHCETLMTSKGYAVIAVADGCRTCLSGGTDIEDVGPWLRDQILARFKEKKKPLTVKYIDPTYTVRSERPNAFDSVYGAVLAEHAVHGAMHGITGVCVAKVNERNVYMPLQVFTKVPRRSVCLSSRWFTRMLFTTQQPRFEPQDHVYPEALTSDRHVSIALRELSTPVAPTDILREGIEIKRMECANLRDTFDSKAMPNPLQNTALASGSEVFLSAERWSLQTITRNGATDMRPKTLLQLLRAAPREVLHFDPSEPGMAAAIVTCGGLCPGLNNVIRELCNMLFAYGVRTVYGIKGGYHGCATSDEWVNLTPESVQDIHMLGGSILVADRGNPPNEVIAQALKAKNVRQFFVLGGDGTHKGAMASFKAMTEIGHECAVVGVPKTIDNDVQVIDRSFGFDSACAEALRAIDSAYVEATTNANCIGLVKLMGRHCGWIATMATLAARHVDVCLIPEMNISLPKLLDHVAAVMRRKRNAVIVVAEGCGDTIIQGTGETDAGGNKQLADVGPFLKDEITRHCKEQGIPITIKYIDPTYMIRSVPANAFDSKYCASLAQAAVHGAMAGYTGITVGMVDGRYVMLPIHAITDRGPRKVDLKSRVYQRLMAATNQPILDP